MPYKVVLFDLDGTLCDPGTSIIDSVAHALERMGIEVTDKSLLKAFVGPPIAHSFHKYFGLEGEKFDEAIGYFREHYQSHGIHQYAPYMGMVELLDELADQGRVMAVATSKPARFTDQILANTGLVKYFQYVAAAKLNDAAKAVTIAEALEGIGKPQLNQVVMVGDREHDVIGAKANSIDSIGVLFGYGSREELEAAGATRLADSVASLRRALNQTSA